MRGARAGDDLAGAGLVGDRKLLTHMGGSGKRLLALGLLGSISGSLCLGRLLSTAAERLNRTREDAVQAVGRHGIEHRLERHPVLLIITVERAHRIRPQDVQQDGAHCPRGQPRNFHRHRPSAMSRDRPDGVVVDACLGRREVDKHVLHGVREDDVGAIRDALRRKPLGEADTGQHLPPVLLWHPLRRR